MSAPVTGRWTSRYMKVYWMDASGDYSILLGPGPGDLSCDNLTSDFTEDVVLYDRGTFAGFEKGRDLQQSLSLTLDLRRRPLTATDKSAVLDALRFAGGWAAATTTDPAGVKGAGKLLAVLDDGAGNHSEVEFPCCKANGSLAEALEGDTLAVTFTNYQAFTVR